MTDQKKAAWQSHINTLNEGITHIYETKEFSDIEFTIGCKKFKAHRLILGAKCQKLADMLFKPNPPRHISDVCSEVGFEIFLRFIYTNEVGTLQNEEILEAYRVATQFEQEELRLKCEEMIREWEISSENVFSTLNQIFDIPVLRERCLRYVKQNSRTVIESRDWCNATAPTLLDLFVNECLADVPVLKLLQSVMYWGAEQFPKPTNYYLVRDLLMNTQIITKLKIHTLSFEELLTFIDQYPDFLTPVEYQQFSLHAFRPGNNPLPDWCDL